MKTSFFIPLSFLFSVLFLFPSCEKNASYTSANQIEIEAKDFTLIVDQKMKIRITSTLPDAKEMMTNFQSADYVVINNKKVASFELENINTKDINDKRGNGKEWLVTGYNEENEIKKITTYQYFESSPNFIFTQTDFVNNSNEKQLISSWNTNHIALKNHNDSPAYYAFQGSSTTNRSDWIRPVDTFYYDKNFMGMNNSDYGGGIPIVDLWRPDIGVAIGHLELTPKQVSFPTELKAVNDDASIRMMQDFDYPTWFESEDQLSSPQSFYTVHAGDYYKPLSSYSSIMQTLGIDMVPSEEAAYEPIWCAWGYERNFTKKEILGTLHKVKELGIKWAVVDDGFQIAEGDWNLDPKKFPKGNIEMKEIVNAIHNKGLKAKLWWTPLAADPGSKVLRENPKSIIYTDEWAPQFITWWDSYYLSPTNPTTIKHTKNTINLFMKEWGFDGLKMDGQHMNAVPPDHNPEAGIEYPELAPEKLPEFFRMIYDEATALKPNAVIENCPCGTCMSFYNMPSMNQAVSSDPLSSWQIRHKGKTYKALVPHIAYYGDHVELSDNANDFATSMGIGAVLGTKFTYPKDNPTASESFLLTPEKEKKWKHWFQLYNEHMISKGNYLGDLYDIGYDKPEAHLIEKEGKLFYAFYADQWNDKIEFKGLDPSKSYSIYDYVNDKKLGTLNAGEKETQLAFTQSLLVQLIAQ